MSNLTPRQQAYLPKIEAMLESYVPKSSAIYANLLDSMRYSLLDGGKRIRPLLMLEFCELCGGNPDNAIPFSCALEMIHTYSLIHDDLPCMDDDDMRRGKASNHKVYGEDIALLAGDALLTLAFAVMLEEDTVRRVGSDRAVKAALILAEAAGMSGMVAGQVIDLSCEGKKVPITTLKQMDERKTGELIRAACEMGCVLAGGTVDQIDAARTFAHGIGLAFQIVDDILDVTSTTETLGKRVGSDALNEKSTYVSELGLEEAERLANQLTDDAIEALNVFPNSVVKSDLITLANYLLIRKK